MRKYLPNMDRTIVMVQNSWATFKPRAAWSKGIDSAIDQSQKLIGKERLLMYLKKATTENICHMLNVHMPESTIRSPPDSVKPKSLLPLSNSTDDCKASTF